MEPRTRTLLSLASTTLALFAPGCPEPTPAADAATVTSDDAATDPTLDAGAGDANVYTGPLGDPDVLVGAFEVELVEATSDRDGYTSAFGKVYDGASPSLVVWEVSQSDGDCTLYVPRVPVCTTPCGSSAACVEDETCAPYPASHAIGAVTMRGLTTAAGTDGFAMSASSSNVYQPVAGTTLGLDAVVEGGDVTLSAAGNGFTGPFEIVTPGIAPLVLAEGELALARDTPLSLSWTAPASPSASSIHVHLDISHHGGTRGQIECDTADDGALTLSGAMITALLDLGVAGYPSIVLERSTTNSAVISAGRVDLSITSNLERFVTVPGLVSCTADTDCSDGQSCQADLTCG